MDTFDPGAIDHCNENYSTGSLVGSLTSPANAIGSGGALGAKAAIPTLKSAVTAVKNSKFVSNVKGAFPRSGHPDTGAWTVDFGKMIGSRTAQSNSKTLTLGKNVKYRIDYENPNPGVRPGQVHYQKGNDKYLYDFESRKFIGMPNNLQKKLAKDPIAQEAIKKGIEKLGGIINE